MDSENEETAPKIPERKNLKPIMVTGDTNIIKVTSELLAGEKLDFEVKLSGNYMKILPYSKILPSLRNKMSIIEYIK